MCVTSYVSANLEHAWRRCCCSDLRPKYITPLEAEELLRRLWASEWRLLALIFGPGSDLAQALPISRCVWERQGIPRRRRKGLCGRL